ncbi:MAG TPA: glycosyltransferase [Parafilimonas sp.]|nr:glycosyltransferase [Parafilimonas sp.]
MKKRNKTFIIFSPAFPDGENDSVWVPWLQTIVQAINNNFPELNVIVFAFQYPYTTKAYSWRNNKIIPFNGFHKGRGARFLMWMKIFIEVRKVKKQYDIVGIFSQWCTECTFVAKYVAKFFRLQYFCWVLGGDARETNTYVKRIRPKPSLLITISDFLVDEFYKNHGIRPQHIIPTGIDISLFDALEEQKDIDVVGVGALSVLKQYDLFVEIIAKLKEHLPDIKTMICGDGEDREHIDEMIKELAVSENLTVTGFIEHRESLMMMQRAKILMHPSSYEGFGTVCLEALYAGAHVISFVQPMYCEIRNWHIVKTKEEMQLKALELLQDLNTKHEKVLVYTTDDAVKKVLKLFGYA